MLQGAGMRSEVCATLSAVFPLVLIAVVQLRPSVHVRLRRIRPYRASIQLAIICSIGGRLTVVIGQELGGLPGPAAMVAWALFGADLFSLVLTVLVVSATSEVAEEEEQARLARKRIRMVQHTTGRNPSR